MVELTWPLSMLRTNTCSGSAMSMVSSQTPNSKTPPSLFLRVWRLGYKRTRAAPISPISAIAFTIEVTPTKSLTLGILMTSKAARPTIPNCLSLFKGTSGSYGESRQRLQVGTTGFRLPHATRVHGLQNLVCGLDTFLRGVLGSIYQHTVQFKQHQSGGKVESL